MPSQAYRGWASQKRDMKRHAARAADVELYHAHRYSYRTRGMPVCGRWRTSVGERRVWLLLHAFDARSLTPLLGRLARNGVRCVVVPIGGSDDTPLQAIVHRSECRSREADSHRQTYPPEHSVGRVRTLFRRIPPHCGQTSTLYATSGRCGRLETERFRG